MPLRLLRHLETIRAMPRDQRSFAAFEKRPDMIAAGAGKDMIDDFDFDDEPALDGVIGDLRLAAERGSSARRRSLSAPLDRPRMEAMRVDANPERFQFSEDMVAGAESRLDSLAPRFLDENVDHFTKVGDDETTSAPRQELIDAIYKLSETALGRQILSHARGNKMRQKFIYDPAETKPGHVDRVTDEWTYNPTASAYSSGQSLEGDGHETADFNVVTGHELGHTAIGRAGLGLPYIEAEEPQPNIGDAYVFRPPWSHTPQQIEEETRTTGEYENRFRGSWGLPPRKSYFTEGDVYRRRGGR